MISVLFHDAMISIPNRFLGWGIMCHLINFAQTLMSIGNQFGKHRQLGQCNCSKLNSLSAKSSCEILNIMVNNEFSSFNFIWIIILSCRKFWENICNVIVAIVPANGLATNGAKPSAGMMITNLISLLYTRPASPDRLSVVFALVCFYKNHYMYT